MPTITTHFAIAAVLSMMGALCMIAMGLYEMYLDQLEAEGRRPGTGFPHGTHMMVSLIIFIASNVLIFLHTVYIAQFVLRGFRYNWHVSWNYFHYIICEIISVVCIIGEYRYLEHPLHLHLMTGVLAVFLFFFNCWAMRIFERREDRVKAEQKERDMRCAMHGDSRRRDFVTIPLTGGDFAGPSTSKK